MPMKRRAKSESGFTMISVVLGMTLVAAISIVSVTVVSGDLHLTRNDLDRKRAYEAARAGVTDYLLQLQKETNYWTQCDKVKKPVVNAVNQVGSTAKRRPVPGNPGTAEYAIELLPAEGQTQYAQCDTKNPTGSMLEPSGILKGTFRIRATGFAGKSKVSLVATFKPATFLDYVYFTQRETLDPVTYGFPNPSPELEGANAQCSKPLQELDAFGTPLALNKAGRNSAPIPNVKDGSGNETTYCVVISFANGDSINGPMHTNDSFVVRGSPTLGRDPADPVEVSGPPKGWFAAKDVPKSGSSESGSNSNFKGTFTANAPVIKPPPSNSALKNIAGLRFKGQVRICLTGATMSVSHGATCTDPDPEGYSGAIPENGVVYVEHNVQCAAVYSPFTVIYPATSTCGNAYIKGSYSGQLTLATENDIIVDGSLIHSDEGVLGLVANNFVRIYHPFSQNEPSTQTGRGDCNGGSNGAGSVKDLQIDAAILAIEHSFIVDHYDCGKTLGTLTVNGAIAQKYRGPVGTGGTTSSTGYIKNYTYDDRLRYLQPPHFIEPAESDWVIGRQTLE